MKILIACDSFKDALPALEVCRAIESGIKKVSDKIDCQLFPLADGGEGTAEILIHHRQGQWIEVQVKDPLFRPVSAAYGLSGDGSTAFIEMAQASGLPLLTQAERRAGKTTSYGTGELIADALKRGVRHILLGIGGSATNDAGLGMAAALGYQFLDKAGKPVIPTGDNLINVRSIDAPEPLPEDLKVEVICDVDNPLFGPNGAAFVYAPQKGATVEEVERLNAGLVHIAAVFKSHFGRDVSRVPGAGAAGGMGAGAMVFLNARLCKGIEIVMKYTGFERQLQGVSLIITGEGRIDHQTAHGKLIQGICRRSAGVGIPVIAFCGALEATPEEIRQIGLRAAFSIMDKPRSLEQALSDTFCLLEQCSFNTISIWRGE